MNATFDIGPDTEADSEAMSLALVFRQTALDGLHRHGHLMPNRSSSKANSATTTTLCVSFYTVGDQAATMDFVVLTATPEGE